MRYTLKALDAHVAKNGDKSVGTFFWVYKEAKTEL
jgi:hypothetical protein